MNAFADWDKRGRTYHLDTSGRILGTNRAARSKFDIGGNDIIGKTLYDIMPKEAADYRIGIIEKIIQSGKPMKIIDTSEGHKKNSRVVPLFDEHGKVNQVLVFVSDMEKKRDVLWERLVYAWDRAQPAAKIATVIGLWFVGQVSKPSFYWRSSILAVVFILLTYLPIFSEIHAVEMLNAILAGGTLTLLVCGTILRYFIR